MTKKKKGRKTRVLLQTYVVKTQCTLPVSNQALEQEYVSTHGPGGILAFQNVKKITDLHRLLKSVYGTILDAQEHSPLLTGQRFII